MQNINVKLKNVTLRCEDTFYIFKDKGRGQKTLKHLINLVQSNLSFFSFYYTYKNFLVNIIFVTDIFTIFNASYPGWCTMFRL